MRWRKSNVDSRLVRLQDLEHCLTQVLQQVPAIGYLYGIRRTLTRTFCIHTAPIAADNLDARVGLEPGSEGFSGSVG